MPSASELAASVVKKIGAESRHKGNIQLGSENLDSKVTGWISTGNPMIDYMIGQPGIPSARLTTIVGMEGAGKSTLALSILRETQKMGGIGVLADTENRLWVDRAAGLGVDMDALITLTPETLEDIMSVIESMSDTIRETDTDIPVTIVIDSIAGTPTQADLDMKFGDSLPAAHARLLSFGLRRIHKKISHQRIALVFVNQLRHKIEFGSWGKPQMVQLGEKSVNYWTSLKIMLEQASLITPGDKKGADPIGANIRVGILDSRISPRKRWQRVIALDFLKGFETEQAALDVLLEIGAITVKGSFCYFDGSKGFYRKDWPAFRKEHPELEDFLQAAPTLWQAGQVGLAEVKDATRHALAAS